MLNRRAIVASLALAGALFAAPGLTQAASTDNLVFTNAFARSTAGMATTGVAYVTITSQGEADTLVAFSSPACNRPELHTHINDNGIMRMRKVDAIEVPAGGVAELKPGGLHLMLIDLNGQLVAGESLDVTLVFEKAGEVALTLPIKGPGAAN